MDANSETQTAPIRMDPARTFRRVPLEPHQMRDAITAQRDLFVLAHVGIPRFDIGAWTLRVTGLVRQSATLSFDQLRQMPKVEVESFHQCAGYPANPTIATRRLGNVIWGGVDLGAFFDKLGVANDARFVWAYGLDRGDYEGVRAEPYVKDCPLDRIAGGGVLLAYEINGEPLDPEHGFPLRLVVPGFYGTNSVKWLTRLHLADRRADGPFTTQLYNDHVDGGTRPVWEVAPESVIVSPAPDEAVVGTQPMEIWGWAWADGGVAMVEVSTDNGASWREAALAGQRGWAWQKFRIAWMPERNGEATLMSRATSTRGEVQPAAGWRNCIYAVSVTVA